jgi:tetratricopeptide (TPR) repeat protein
MTHPPDHGRHPDPILLERFMRNEVETAERRWIVRHLIAGCSRCVAVTSRLWSLGDPPAVAEPLAPAAGARATRAKGPGARRSLARGHSAEPAEAYGDLFERLADVGRRIEEEREQAPRLAAELLASSPAARAALLARLDAVRSVGSPGSPASPASPGSESLGPAVLTPAVCEVLLDRSRDAAASEPAVALQAAEMALAIAERLDPVACGGTVARGLRVRAWAHLAQARRLGDDLDGAEWALAVAEALASGIAGRAAAADAAPAAAAATGAGAFGAPGAHGSDTAAGGPGDRAGTGAGAVPLEPAEWAELLVFKAGLFADRGDLRGADRLLGRAAELFHAGAEPRRAGRTLVQEGLIRAELGDRERAAELLRAGVDLLDPAAEPALVAANLYRLATLLRGIAMEATATAAAAATPAAKAARTAGASEPRAAGAAGDHHDAGTAGHAGDIAQAPLTAASAHACGVEALQLVERARVLYRELGDAAAEAYLSRLQGQIEAALGKLEEAAATLLAATAALAQQGLGREAALAQIELALVLLRQGRAAEIRRLGLDLRPVKQARDKSWPWAAALLVFQVTANEPSHLAHPGEIMLLGELARFLAPRPQHAPQQPHGRRQRRLERVA